MNKMLYAAVLVLSFSLSVFSADSEVEKESSGDWLTDFFARCDLERIMHHDGPTPLDNPFGETRLGRLEKRQGDLEEQMRFFIGAFEREKKKSSDQICSLWRSVLSQQKTTISNVQLCERVNMNRLRNNRVIGSLQNTVSSISFQLNALRREGQRDRSEQEQLGKVVASLNHLIVTEVQRLEREILAVRSRAESSGSRPMLVIQPGRSRAGRSRGSRGRGRK